MDLGTKTQRHISHILKTNVETLLVIKACMLTENVYSKLLCHVRVDEKVQPDSQINVSSLICLCFHMYLPKITIENNYKKEDSIKQFSSIIKL